MISENIEKMIKCLALLGFIAFSAGFIFLIVRILQSLDVSWEVHTMVIGLFLLLLALVAAKLLSKDW